MSDSTNDRIDGAKDTLLGHGKELMGMVTGDEQTQTEGQMDQASGSLKQGVADLKDGINNVVKNLTDQTR